MSQRPLHSRTRSQQQLTSLDIEYTRSPLKSARDALRRANARTSPPATSSLKYDVTEEGKGEDVEGNEENRPCGSPRLGGGKKMKERGEEHGMGDQSDPASPDLHAADSRPDDSSKQNMLKRSRSPSSERAKRNPFDFSGLSNSESGSNGGQATQTKETLTVLQAGLETKRPKLTDGGNGKQATLHNFFVKANTSKDSASGRSSSNQHEPNATASTSTPKALQALTSNSPSIMVHATPTINQLRAMPTLDLRTMTPSPRKPSLQLHRSIPSPHKQRSVSLGSALKEVSAPSIPEEDMEEVSSSSRLTTTEKPGNTDQEQEQILQTNKHDVAPEVIAEGQVTLNESRQEPSPEKPSPAAEFSISVQSEQSNPSHASVPPPSSTLKQSFKDSLLPPMTPKHKILPSRSLGFLSPLTPLPDETYDYEEEERAVQEHERKLEEAQKRKREAQQSNSAQISDKSGQAASSMVQSDSKIGKDVSKKSTSRRASPADTRSKKSKKTISSTSSANRGAAPITKRAPDLRRKLGVLSTAPSSPRMRTTRAQLLRQKAMQPRKSISTPKAPSALRHSAAAPELGSSKSEEDVKTGAGSMTKIAKVESDAESKKEAAPKRKPFVLTVPSSLSPVKSSAATSISSPASSRVFGTKKIDSKPFTYSFYPPDISDPTAAARSKRTLSNLSSALQKLRMPPPEKPASSSSTRTAPASEQTERVRPATSLGFNRELSLPPLDLMKSEQRQRPQSRSAMLPPAKTVPRFGSASSNTSGSSGLPRSSGFRVGFNSNSRGTGIFGRHIPRMRASQKTSLETVEGSPVKGSSSQAMVEESSEMEVEQIDVDATGGSAVRSANGESFDAGDISVSSSDGTPSANEKDLKRISKLNASRRASMAFSALAQSLTTPSPTNASVREAESQKMSSDIEAMPPPPTLEKKQVKSSSFNGSSSRPVRAAAQRALTSGYGMVRAESEDMIGPSEAGVTPMAKAESDSELGMSKGSKRGLGMAGRSRMPGSLDVLAHCTILVDVRTEDGEDAGGLFVDMLRGLGAKIRSSVGQTCTHIVYKNGLSSTVTKYRLLDEPRPHVVGIGWVVECVEKRACVDVNRFKINLEEVNVAGTLKRKRSILHKPASSAGVSGPMDAFLGGSTSSKPTPTEPIGVPKARHSPDSDDGEVPRSSSMASSFNPLERARRRSFMVSQ